MKKYLKLYKNGKFYNAFGDDGIIIHYLLGYKYLEYKNSVGFPVSAYNKVIGRLRKMEIPFLIYDKDLLMEKDDGISKKYNEVLKIALSKYDMEKRVNRIIEKIDNYTIQELEDKFINE